MGRLPEFAEVLSRLTAIETEHHRQLDRLDIFEDRLEELAHLAELPTNSRELAWQVGEARAKDLRSELLLENAAQAAARKSAVRAHLELNPWVRIDLGEGHEEIGTQGDPRPVGKRVGFLVSSQRGPIYESMPLADWDDHLAHDAALRRHVEAGRLKVRELTVDEAIEERSQR